MNRLTLQMPAKGLSQLVAGLGDYTSDVRIGGIVDDTRQLKAGDAFLCLPRARNIETLVEDAVAKGAVAVIFVAQTRLAIETPHAWLPDMQAAGEMLRRWFETESCALPCIGVTGTDGKTSTAWMLREVLMQHLGSAWSCGTLGLVRKADDITDLGNTTPSLLSLHTLLGQAVKENIGALVLEVSSHGIDQQRIAGLPFTAAVWTTIGQDHLEDHGGFEAYLDCKKSFVEAVAKAGGLVVANGDYPLIRTALADTAPRTCWYRHREQADLVWSTKQGLNFSDPSGELLMQDVPLADFHAENLAAVVLLFTRLFEQPLSSFAAFDGKLTTPMGRLEPVGDSQQVFIDYAHTAEGLSRCLQSARNLTSQQLLLVFGCGGDRDKAKRPAMGAVAVKYADECWLTSDNPRSEKQTDIAADVLSGVTENSDKIHLCEDRDEAIEQAVRALAYGDILVIAGKGHESYMELAGERLPWSDKASALKAMAKKEVQQCA